MSKKKDKIFNISVMELKIKAWIFIYNLKLFLSNSIITEFVEVPAKLSKWQGFYMKFGNVTFWIVIDSVIIGITLLLLKIRYKYFR